MTPANYCYSNCWLFDCWLLEFLNVEVPVFPSMVEGFDYILCRKLTSIVVIIVEWLMAGKPRRRWKNRFVQELRINVKVNSEEKGHGPTCQKETARYAMFSLCFVGEVSTLTIFFLSLELEVFLCRRAENFSPKVIDWRPSRLLQFKKLFRPTSTARCRHRLRRVFGSQVLLTSRPELGRKWNSKAPRASWWHFKYSWTRLRLEWP